MENYWGYLKRFSLPKTSILCILVRAKTFLPLALRHALFNVSSMSENTWSWRKVIIHQFPHRARRHLKHPKNQQPKILMKMLSKVKDPQWRNCSPSKFRTLPFPTVCQILMRVLKYMYFTMSSKALTVAGQLAEPVHRICDHTCGASRGQNVLKRYCGIWTK